MPIIDYQRAAKLAEQAFFASDISKGNKEHIRRFLDVYNVSPARRAIFLKHIWMVLVKTPDIARSLHDRQTINRIFRDIHDTLSPSYYGTVVNVALRFATWLNDGQRPDGFRDIRNVPKLSQRRNLSPRDMLTWDDGLRLIAATNSIQLKAVIATQLDGGFRPSEFVDLNCGDAEVNGDFIVVSVNHGKTGPRSVVLWRALPYLLRWLHNHPAKRKNAPLWVQEANAAQKVCRYGYFALQKRLKELGRRLGIEKPLDFYNLRHSACTMSKMDNVPEEIAAAKFGHSVEYYTSTYGRRSDRYLP